MSQSNLAEMGFSPEEAERFAAAFRPSWELGGPEDVPTVSAISAIAVTPEPDTSSRRALQKTLIMADAPGQVPASANSGPLPSFDLPVSAPKLPPAPVSESDVMKTAVYKPVNAADIDLPDDLPTATPKKSPVLFIGIGIAAVLAIAVGIGVAAMGSKSEESVAPTAVQPGKPRETADIPPVEVKPEPPVEAKKAEPTKPEPVKPEPAKAEPSEAKGAPKSGAASKPAAAAQSPVVAKPTTPAAPKPAGGPAAKPGGIVRDTPF
jgi:hypothetical protein